MKKRCQIIVDSVLPVLWMLGLFLDKIGKMAYDDCSVAVEAE